MEIAVSSSRFLIAGASVPGRLHTQLGRNNQDAALWASWEDHLLLLACDGCGSSAHSEVGSQAGCRMLAGSFRRHLSAPTGTPGVSDDALFESVRQDVLLRLRALADSLGEPLLDVVGEYLLFTVVGALITPTDSVVFAIGDGFALLNGERLPIDRFEDDAPPYLAYQLLPPLATPFSDEQLRFQVARRVSTTEVRSLLIGSDGAIDLQAAAAARFPGTDEIIGDISRLWEERRFLDNQDALRRHLARVNRTAVRLRRDKGGLAREMGLLPDDTSLIVVRRISDEGEEQPCTST
jgi:hypothetical protein